MIRTVIRHSQRFAGLMLLAALAVTAAPAQQQNKKAVIERRPVTRDIKRLPREIARKPVERVLETEKTRAGKTAELRRVREGIAVGEPNGRIKRKVEEQKDAPKKLKEASDGPKRQRIDQGPLAQAAGVPQRTKDAIGSPQRADQKSEGKAKLAEKKTDELRKKRKLDPQDIGKGAVAERKSKGDAADFAKRKIAKAKVKKIDAKLAEKEASPLIRRGN